MSSARFYYFINPYAELRQTVLCWERRHDDDEDDKQQLMKRKKALYYCLRMHSCLSIIISQAKSW